jgi:cell wall assembly regulator SMI1
MTDEPRALDTDLLTEYAALLASQGVPTDQWDRPGLTDAQLDEATAALGLDLPEEARVIWRWHDGIESSAGANALGAVGEQLLSIASAVAEAQEHRTLLTKACREMGTEGDPRYHPGWLPLIGPEYPLVIDCRVGRNDPSPVRIISWEDPNPPPVVARSIGEVFALWGDLIRMGAWLWNTDSADWEVDTDRLPADHPRSLMS